MCDSHCCLRSIKKKKKIYLIRLKDIYCLEVIINENQIKEDMNEMYF